MVQTSPRGQPHWGFLASRVWGSTDSGCELQESVLVREGKGERLSISSQFTLNMIRVQWLLTIIPATEARTKEF